MFKKDITPGAKSKVKSSVQRAIRTKITDTYPLLTPHIDEIIPKKSQLDLLKLYLSPPPPQISPNPLPHTNPLPSSGGNHNRPDRITLYALDTHPLFFQHMDDAITPHLRLVHAYPHAFPRVRIDRGAVRFVLAGATLMAPGLTSAGGRLPAGHVVPIKEGGDDEGGGEGKGGDGEAGGRYGGRELEEGEVVIVEAEGKEEACLVGQLRMGTREIKEEKKGVVVDAGHFLGDGLWRMVLE
ncbi:MAG: hypothetical protein L6R37_007881 [Teloschistes peruensis]|nr:MAG: hypothetical protein L6R37_007881 [Teloschistes peruensis]